MRDQRIVQACQDPIFFSILLCGQDWLIQPGAKTHRRFLSDDWGRIVAACGRGWGKSLLTSLKAITMLYNYAPVEILIVSSSQRQSMQIFEYLYGHVHRTNTLDKTVRRETRTTIKLKHPFYSKVTALPCSPNKLRGRHPDVLIPDEASIIPAKMVSSELLLMLTKKYPPGDLKQAPLWPKLIMLGTPWAYDHPFRLAYNNPDFHTYNEPSYTSPLVNADMLQEWKALMTEDEWEREVEAKWVELENTYFPLELINRCVDPTLSLFQSLEEIPFWVNRIGRNFGGLDLGKQRTFSVLSVVNFDGIKLKHVHTKAFPLGTEYASVQAYCAEAYKRLQFGNLVVDKTGVGDPIVEELIRIGVPAVEGVFLTEPMKETVFGAMKLGMEQDRVKITDWKPLMNQMSEQTYEYLRPDLKRESERLHFKFNKPSGKYDDILISFVLAGYGAFKIGVGKPFVSGVKKGGGRGAVIDGLMRRHQVPYSIDSFYDVSWERLVLRQWPLEKRLYRRSQTLDLLLKR